MCPRNCRGDDRRSLVARTAIVSFGNMRLFAGTENTSVAELESGERIWWIATTGVALLGEVARMYEEGYLARENSNREAHSRQREVLPWSPHRSAVGHDAPKPDPTQSRRGLAAHDLRFLVDLDGRKLLLGFPMGVSNRLSAARGQLHLTSAPKR